MLSRGLNNLLEDKELIDSVPKWSPPINHLSYANDTILFCSGEKKSIQMMIGVLKGYEKISVHMINLNKSFYYLHDIHS